ncbi:hypothetical protein GF314_07390 [bacterium]|nr:hypothetical protein [bacterium]
MSLIDRQRFDALRRARGGDRPRVSIYQPTHRAGRDIREDPIRLKNLLRQAEAALGEWGLGEQECADLLAPATALLDQGSFWERQSDGLALFLDAEGRTEFRCPRRFDELCYVHDHFHVKPLLPLLRWDTVFHLLALSLNRVRLYEVTVDDLDEVALGDIPESLPAALGHELAEPSLQHHGGPRSGNGRATLYHGQGAGEDDRVREIVKFLHMVDDGLRAHLRDPQAPVVLAGVEELVHRFHNLSKHKGLVPGGMLGNHDRTDPHELHAEAWNTARDVVEHDARQAIARFEELRGTERATADPEAIGPAAAAGRVETLLVAADRVIWGRLGSDGSVKVHPEREAGDVDLVDRLADLGMELGADVVARRADKLPDGVVVAAVMRY